MKKTAKVVLSSVIMIVMCISLIAGSTFALFTSDDSVNIAVTSGKVKVSAKIDNVTTYSYLLDDEDGTYKSTEMEDNTAFIYGTAIYTDGMFTLNNMVPGDKVTFDLVVENESNVNIKYQTAVSYSGNSALANALVISDSFGEGMISVGGSRLESKWNTWSIDDDTTKTIKMSIELPYDYDDNSNDKGSIQGEKCDLTFYVSAVQGNAEREDPTGFQTITPQDGNNVSITEAGNYSFSGEFGAMEITINADLLASGATVVLDGTGATFTDIVTITAGGVADHVVDLTATRSGNVIINGFTVPNYLWVKSCSVESLTVSGCTLDMLAFNASNTAVTVTGNTIEHEESAFPAGNDTYYAMYFYADNYDLVMEDNTIINKTSQSKAAVAIVGNYPNFQPEGVETSNSIKLSGNTISTVGNNLFKVWNDVTYAPVEYPEDYRVTEAALDLAEQLFNPVYKNNCSVEHAPDGQQHKGDAIIEITCRKAGDPGTFDATEQSFDAFKTIWEKYN